MTKQEIIALIESEARAAGLDPACMVRIAQIESNFIPTAINRNGKKPSLAAGLYQIMPFHNVPNVLDPLTNIRWAMRYAKQNHEYLRKNGVPVDCFWTYLAHQQGAGGAVSLWKKRNLRIDQLTAEERRNLLANVGANDFTTVAQFLQFWERKVTNNIVGRAVASLPDTLQISLARATDYQLTAILVAGLGVVASACITKFVERKPLWSKA